MSVLGRRRKYSSLRKRNNIRKIHQHRENINLTQNFLQTAAPGKIYGFYHVALMKNWMDIVRRQLASIIASGLYNKTDTIFINVLGPAEHYMAFKGMIDNHTKFKIVYHNSELSLFEFPILEFMRNFCIKNPHVKCWYIHTKGASIGESHVHLFGIPLEKIKKNVEEWRFYMDFFIVQQNSRCIESLDHHDVVGVNWRTNPKPHFSGNFWWARGDYIKSLPNLNLMSAAVEAEKRWLCEFWLGSNPHARVNNILTIPAGYNVSCPISKYRNVKVVIDPNDVNIEIGYEKEAKIIESLDKSNINIKKNKLGELLMKYSVILPLAGNRIKQFKYGLKSWQDQKFDKRRFELIIVDQTNDPKYSELFKKFNLNIRHIVVDLNKVNYAGCMNPAYAQNVAVKNSLGQYLIFTSPEVVLEENGLSKIDRRIHEGIFLYAAVSECPEIRGDVKYTNDYLKSLRSTMWLSHPVHRPLLFTYFLGVVHKNPVVEIGGIDEKFMQSVGYDDNDFSNRIMSRVEPLFLNENELMAVHVSHNRDYQASLAARTHWGERYLKSKTFNKPEDYVANKEINWGSENGIVFRKTFSFKEEN